MQPDEPVIDTGALREQFDGDEELLHEVIELFIEDHPKQLTEIERAIHATDAPALEMAAHTLKGSVSNFAAPRAGAAAERLERMGRTGALDGAIEALADLVEAMRDVVVELRRIRDRAA